MPVWSINRVVIAGLPGVELPPEVAGKTGLQLLAAEVLAARVRESAVLQKRRARNVDDLALLNESLGAADASLIHAATSIAEHYGRDLGLLLATLKRGDAVNREVRPEWSEVQWSRWAGIRKIWLGGGLANGTLGAVILAKARAQLRSAGVDCVVDLADNPSYLALTGLARVTSLKNGFAFLADFGQTTVKRGLAKYRAGLLERLDVLPQVAAPRHVTSVEKLAGDIAGLIGDGIGACPDEPAAIGVSVATYLERGHPPAYAGGDYARLHDLPMNLGEWLKSALREHRGSGDLVLMHDGTAAAQAFGDGPGAAVITLGTALGVGFTSAQARLAPLSPDFSVTRP